MNTLYNPLLILKAIKFYLKDMDNLERFNQEKLKRIRDKKFRETLKRAYQFPMYRNLYKKAGIKPGDIKGIEDINKLPLVSKEKMQKYFSDGIISSKKKEEKLTKVTTSGTTGKSLSIYVDATDIIIGLLGYLRSFREYNVNWKNDKITIIADFGSHTAETGYIKKFLTKNSWFSSFFKNIQWLNTNDKPEEVMRKISRFKPDFIGGYTGMLGHLAVLNEKRKGGKVSPEYIGSTGAVLDSSLKKFIENSFKASVFEVYGTTETGPIAFQCKEEREYHIMSDLVHLEFLKNGEKATSKEPSEIAVTKLYGKGTPIIRYKAIDDIVAPLEKKPKCGLSGDLIYKIYGRKNICFYRSDGKILLSSAYSDIFSRLLYELKTSKVRDMKVIQHNLEKFEIKLVIEEGLKGKKPSVDTIFSTLEEGFCEKFGSNVEIVKKEVEKVGRKEPRIVSKVNPDDLKITGYL